jgi:hypothetical protein
MEYKIYRLPHYVNPNGKIGKIGCATDINNRFRYYSEIDIIDWEIIETHTDIYKASEREVELQKQYGYTVDTAPYYITYENRKAKATKETMAAGGRKSGRQNVLSGHLANIRELASINNRQPVLQFDKQGNFIKEYASILEAERMLYIRNQNICAAAAGKRHSAGGFIWKYK